MQEKEPERRGMHLDGGNICLLMRLLGLLAVQGSEGIHEALEERSLFAEGVGDGGLGVLLVAE